jgi:hypothetical protein
MAGGLGLAVLLTGTGAGASTLSSQGYADAVNADSPLHWWTLSESGAGGQYFDRGSAAVALSPGTDLGRGQTPLFDYNELGAASVANGGSTSSFAHTDDVSAVHPAPPFTFEAQVLPTAGAGSFRTIMSDDTSGSGNGIWWAINSTNTQRVGVNGQTSCNGTHTIAVGTPSELAFTHDGTTLKLYVNGQLDATCTVAPPNWASVTQPWLFGMRNDNSFGMQGRMEDVAIYPSALSAQALQIHYNAATTGVGPGGGSTTTVTTPGGTTTVTTTETTPGTTVTETVVSGGLDAGDQARLDLSWEGTWALVGLGLAALTLPFWRAAFRWFR